MAVVVNYQISERFWRGSNILLNSEHSITLLVRLRACWRILFAKAHEVT